LKPKSSFTSFGADKHMLDHKDLSLTDQNGPYTIVKSPNINTPEKILESKELKYSNPTLEETKIEELHKEETLNKNTQDEVDKKENALYNKVKWALINLGPLGTAVGHAYAGINDLWFFKNFEDSKIRQFVDKAALNFSKLILTASCGFNGYEALKKNRLWEAISRFIEPIFIIAERRTEDLGLARGIGLGISQLVGSQEGIYNELVKQDLGFDLTDKNEKRTPTMGQDHDLNIKAFKKLSTEIVKGGFGSNRRFLTGLSLNNIQEKLSQLFKDFNFGSIKELFSGKGDLAQRYENFCNKSGIYNIQSLCKGDEKKDKGHTTALSGYTMILGSLLGYMGKESKGLAYKVGGTIRNLGGIIADVSIFGHKDPYFNASAIFLSVNTFMDIVQRFIPPAMKQIVLPWSNISMAAYNIGCGLYLNRSDMKTNNQDKVQSYDTDLTKAVKLSKATELVNSYATAA
jgi:hypothetical protein